MADGLDVVAVRVEDEGTVIVRMILRAQARRAIIASAGSERGGVERAHLRLVLRGESHVDRAGWFAAAADPEPALTFAVEASPTVALLHDANTERGQRGEIERPAFSEVA